jgi:hypothetical protein
MFLTLRMAKRFVQRKLRDETKPARGRQTIAQRFNAGKAMAEWGVPSGTAECLGYDNSFVPAGTLAVSSEPADESAGYSLSP